MHLKVPGVNPNTGSAGPSGSLSSASNTGRKLGGSKSPQVSSSKGLTGAQMKTPIGKGRSLSGRR